MSTAVRSGSPVRRRLTGALVVALATASTVAGAFYASLSGAFDAPARVARILAEHHGTPVTIAPDAKVARAIVAIEDERFFAHGALDPIALGRIALHPVLGGTDPGGATIAQQLARTLYVTGPETFAGRLRAVGMAFKLESSYTKPQILSMYLNAIYFGHGFYGIGRASRGYFGVPPDRLSWSQAAMLAGLPQAPSAYDPIRHLALARARQRAVIHQLAATHVLPG